MTKYVAVHIGQKIRKLRTKSDMTQAELATRLGLSSASTISHFETGERQISVDLLFHISVIFDVPPGLFFLELPRD